jgi:cyclophilin family peptidyl-prolyl cis-trans isomerase
MVVELFNETPLHRDNFVDLVENGFYDSLQFHRVIEKFMIQGGDPTSKNADSTANLGDGGPGYTLPAEIVDTIFHRRGALAAAREGDQINPHRRSSGSQFYIVQGQVINARQIADVNRKRVMMYGNQAFQKYLNDSANVDFKAEF